MNYEKRNRTLKHVAEVKDICDSLAKYQETRKLFPMMEYTEKLNIICENLDHVLSVCEKEDRIDNIRSAANQYEA